jgi:hypothetical protein
MIVSPCCVHVTQPLLDAAVARIQAAQAKAAPSSNGKRKARSRYEMECVRGF